jgi:hypothetical protein
MFAIGGGGEAGDPQVDTDRGSGRFEGPGGHLVAGQDQHPAAPLMANLDGLDPAFHSAVDADLYLSDSLQVHPAGVRLPTAAITVLGPFDTVEPVRWLEPGVARRLASVDPPEEAGERPAQPAQRRLLGRERPHRHIRPDRPDLLELRRLLRVGDAGPSQPPGVSSFLEGGVVQLAVRCQALPQGDMLASGGSKPEFVGPPQTDSPWYPSPNSPSLRRPEAK